MSDTWRVKLHKLVKQSLNEQDSHKWWTTANTKWLQLCHICGYWAKIVYSCSWESFSEHTLSTVRSHELLSWTLACKAVGDVHSFKESYFNFNFKKFMLNYESTVYAIQISVLHSKVIKYVVKKHFKCPVLQSTGNRLKTAESHWFWAQVQVLYWNCLSIECTCR